MKLYCSPRSPFVRKIMIVMHETKLLDRVTCVPTVVGMAAEPNPALLPDNPLCKIPTLVLGDGRRLFDSRVIAEYLDSLHDGPQVFPTGARERYQHLRWLSLGDGMTDMLILWRNERVRPEGMRDPALLSAFEKKTRACFVQLEAEAAELQAAPFGIGQIALVCMLGFMDLQLNTRQWRQAHPAFAEWHEEMRKRPSVQATEVSDQGASNVQSGRAAGPALIF
jgi:glutathione S-transferase